jgi:hypothetical protein
MQYRLDKKPENGTAVCRLNTVFDVESTCY